MITLTISKIESPIKHVKHCWFYQNYDGGIKWKVRENNTLRIYLILQMRICPHERSTNFLLSQEKNRVNYNWYIIYSTVFFLFFGFVLFKIYIYILYITSIYLFIFFKESVKKKKGTNPFSVNNNYFDLQHKLTKWAHN